MQEEKSLFTICLLWSWWDARNKTNAGEQRRPVANIIHKARSVLVEVVDESEAKNNSEPTNRCRRWSAPQPGTWKINVDGAFWEKERKGSLGFVARDDQGNAAIAGAGSLDVVMDALCSEAHACIAGLHAAADQGCRTL
jgi:hypothetical protein